MCAWPTARILPLAPLLLLLGAGCNRAPATPEIKQNGIFIQSAGNLIEMRKLGTLGTTYGPRLYPEIPDYDIPVVPAVGLIYVNMPDVPVATLKGIEWHGYRLGGNGSVGSPSTATAQDWKAVPLVSEPTATAGLFKVRVERADAKTARWKPEASHEYFGLTIEAGYKPSPIWAVRIK